MKFEQKSFSFNQYFKLAFIFKSLVYMFYFSDIFSSIVIGLYALIILLAYLLVYFYVSI